MPHCIIEYSNDLENQITSSTMRNIHNAIFASELFESENIKVRALPVSKYIVGGVVESFIHVTLKILDGRIEEVKEKLSNDLLDTVIEEFKNVKNITVDIVELNSNFYRKLII